MEREGLTSPVEGETAVRSPRRSGEHSFTDDEIEKIFQALARDRKMIHGGKMPRAIRDEVFIRFALATGLRRYDLSRIEIRNIDLNNQKFMYVEKKKRNRLRTLYFGDKLAGLLRNYIQYLKIAKPTQKTLLGVSSRQLWNILDRLCEDAGVSFVDRGVHVLRATGFKRLFEAGWDITELCHLSGDKEKTLRDHYLCTSEEDLKDTAKKKEVW